MIVCHCHQVNDRTIDHAIAAGATDVEAVASACHAGSDCGGCHETIDELLARCERLLDHADRRAVA